MIAESTIRAAIRAGASAYNTGQVFHCERTYEDAAWSLLARREELKPDVARALEAALQRSEALQALSSTMQRQDADKLAWAFRKAFDNQLSAASSLPTHHQDAIVEAISRGAPAYNSGDVEGCRDLYMRVAQEVLADPDVPSEAQAILSGAIETCQQSHSLDADKCSWVLRRALDAVMLPSGAQQQSTVAPEASPPAEALICNFGSGEGIKVRATIGNDTVMGGRSDSDIVSGSQGATFQGQLVKRGGGFVSVRFEPEDVTALLQLLQSGSGVRLLTQRLRGCSAWKFQLNSDAGIFRSWGFRSYSETQWQADFETSETESEVRIPFSSLVPTNRGRPTGARGIDRSSLSNVQGFGFVCSFLTDSGSPHPGFEEGPFALRLVSLGVY